MSVVEISHFRDDRPWLFGRVPDGYWKARENRVCYIEWLGKQLGFAGREEWYQARNMDFIRNHGGTLIRKYYISSVYVAMRDYAPRYKWIPWLFSQTPKGFWQKAENRKSYMKWLEGLLKEAGSIQTWWNFLLWMLPGVTGIIFAGCSVLP